MNLLNIRHRKTYRYREPVQLEPHRFLLRPREGHTGLPLTNDFSDCGGDCPLRPHVRYSYPHAKTSNRSTITWVGSGCWWAKIFLQKNNADLSRAKS